MKKLKQEKWEEVEKSGVAITTLAKKWLKTPHNRFKMRRNPPRYKQEADRSPEARPLSIKRTRGEEAEESCYSNYYQLIIRSQSTTTGAFSNNQCRQTAMTNKHGQDNARRRMPIRLLIAMVLMGLADLTIAKTAPAAPTSQVSPQVSAQRPPPTGGLSAAPSPPPQVPPIIMKTATTTRQPANHPTAAQQPRPLSPHQPEMASPPSSLMAEITPIIKTSQQRLEEEVTLISGGHSRTTAELVVAPATSSHSQLAKRQPRRPQLIRIQAAPLNGKLVGPARIESGQDGDSTGSPRQSTGTSGLAEGTATATDTTTQPWKPVAPITTPRTTPQIDAHSLELITESESESEQQACSQQPETDGTQVHHASIDTSSGMLRLTKAPGNRTRARQLLGNSGGARTEPLESTSASVAPTSDPHHQQPQQQQRHQTSPQSALVAALSIQQQQSPLARMSLASLESSGAGSGNDSILSLIDDYDSKIITNRTKAQLSCDSGEMVLRLNFSDSFKGIVYPDHNRLSPCRFFGDGHHNYELRLPLRGCGTRQAAPRVFVNDVIVRFHKTLELEEDEVKTLICRYPPPLAPEPLPTDTGPTHNPAVIGNRKHSTTQPNSVIEQEGPAQFEFIDSLSGRPKLPEPPGNSGTIETLSENLIVAPASGGGGGHNQKPITMDYDQANPFDVINNNHNRPGLRHRTDPHPSSSSDLMNPRNSLILDPPPPPPPSSSSIGSSFLERFSSVELLFLISSLMFLVLLALGLATSYYCFRRHAHRGSVKRASAILKRRRRYNGPSGALLHDHHHGTSAVTMATAAAAAAAARQDYYSGQRMAGSGGSGGPYRSGGGGGGASLTAPSSPESDLSARNLLAPGTSQHMASYRSLHPSYPGYNQAFVPDGGSGGAHYAATPYLAGAATSGYTMDQMSGRRQRSMQQLRLPTSTTATATMTPGQPVVGRRDTNIGRQQRHQQPQRYHLSPTFVAPHTNLRPPKQGASQFSPTPLGPPLAPTAASTAKVKLNLLEQPMGPNYGGTIMPNPKNNRTIIDMNRNYGNDLYHNAAQLSRAKSLSSVRYLEPLPVRISGTGLHPRGEQFAGGVGGTEIRGRKRRQRLPHQDPDPGGRQSEMRRPHWSNYIREYSSDSEMEQNNNGGIGPASTRQQSSGGHRAPPPPLHQKPSILLKSIEDSYITNFTEIYEQEYSKRDSTRPLSMSQWRAMQPSKAGRPGDGGNQDQDDLSSSPSKGQPDVSNGSSRGAKTMGEHGTSDDDDDDDETILGHDDGGQGYHSTHTNLRSLTELDVNFAKSLLAPSMPALRAAMSGEQVAAASGSLATQESTQAIATSSKTDDGDETHLTNDPSAQVSHKPPEAKLVDDPNQQVRSSRSVNGGAEDVGRQRQVSPDLILSPDYEHNRLDLEARKNISSHNSVSYV